MFSLHSWLECGLNAILLKEKILKLIDCADAFVTTVRSLIVHRRHWTGQIEGDLHKSGSGVIRVSPQFEQMTCSCV